jgi:uncharacterized membrane protein
LLKTFFATGASETLAAQCSVRNNLTARFATLGSDLNEIVCPVPFVIFVRIFIFVFHAVLSGLFTKLFNHKLS